MILSDFPCFLGLDPKRFCRISAILPAESFRIRQNRFGSRNRDSARILLDARSIGMSDESIKILFEFGMSWIRNDSAGDWISRHPSNGETVLRRVYDVNLDVNLFKSHE